jgi:hypothetical protein
MLGSGKVRQTIDSVTAAASDTRNVIIALGALAMVALGVAVVALILAARRGRGVRA